MIHPETMLVQPWGEGQGDHVVIDKGDFDPAIHEPFPAEDKAPDPFKGLTVPDLKQLAEEHSVDLSEATKRGQIVSALVAAGIEPPAAE